MTAAPALTRTAEVSQAIRRDSLWLFSGYVVTAGIGFGFWIVAALLVPPAQLGTEAALISVFSAAAAVTSSGVGSAMVVMLPAAGPYRARLVRRAYAVTVGVGTVLGLVAGVIAGWALRAPGEQWWTLALGIALMTVVWAAFNLKDQVLTGLDQAKWTLFLNAPANVGKLLLTLGLTIPALAIGHPLVVATIVPAGLALVVTVGFLQPRFLRASADPGNADVDPEALNAGLRRFATRDTVAIGVALGANLLTPFLVTVLAGPVESALFALALQIGLAVDLVTTGVATALAKNGSTEHATSVALSFRLWRQVVLVVLAVSSAMVIATPVLFGMLGRSYEPGRGALVVGLLCFACVIRSGYTIWSALMRANQQVLPVLVANAGGAALMVALLAALTPAFGAAGAAAGVFVAAVFHGLVGLVGLRRLRHRNVGEGEA